MTFEELNLGTIWEKLNEKDIQMVRKSVVLYSNDQKYSYMFSEEQNKVIFIPLSVIRKSLVNHLKWYKRTGFTSVKVKMSVFEKARIERILKLIDKVQDDTC